MIGGKISRTGLQSAVVMARGKRALAGKPAGKYGPQDSVNLRLSGVGSAKGG